MAWAYEPVSAQDTSKSLIFKIFSLDDIDSRKYEKGYIIDRIFRRREFHKPVNFIPIEIRYGFGYNIGGGFLGLGNLKSNWMSYESDVNKFDGGEMVSRLGHQLDLDILKTNFAYIGLGTVGWICIRESISAIHLSCCHQFYLPNGLF